MLSPLFILSFWISISVNFAPFLASCFYVTFLLLCKKLSDHGNDDDMDEFRFVIILFNFLRFVEFRLSLFTGSFLNVHFFRNRIDKFYFQFSIKVTFLMCKFFLAISYSLLLFCFGLVCFFKHRVSLSYDLLLL